jgi:epsilon-lactone hydrolase
MNTQIHEKNVGVGPWSEIHPLTQEDGAVVAAMRTMLGSQKGLLQGTAARPIYDEIIGHVSAAEGVTYESDTVGGIFGWWCHPTDARPGEAILHLHGGWYVWGSAKAYRHLAGHIAARAGASVFIADYRLAPEHPFPAALLDAQASYRGLIARGVQRIAIVGDSAGGGLGLALLSLAAAEAALGKVVPVAAVALSPVTDLTLSGPSWEDRAAADLYFTAPQCAALIRAYLGAHNPADPLASPLYGNLNGLPPIRVHVGEDEMLLDDSRRYIERAVAAGVDAKVDVWQGMPHVFPNGVGRLGAAAQALDAIGTFLSERLQAEPHGFPQT